MRAVRPDAERPAHRRARPRSPNENPAPTSQLPAGRDTRDTATFAVKPCANSPTPALNRNCSPASVPPYGCTSPTPTPGDTYGTSRNPRGDGTSDTGTEIAPDTSVVSLGCAYPSCEVSPMSTAAVLSPRPTLNATRFWLNPTDPITCD